jgi:O-antigen/teichoic acid export membrane protein
MKKISYAEIKDHIKELFGLLNGTGTKSRLIKDGMGSLIINVGNKALVLLTGILLVRLVGKFQYGIYSYVLSIMYVLMIPAEFGIANLLVRETAQGITRQDHPTIKGIWRWSFRISTLLCITILLIAGLGSIWAKDYFSQIEMSTFYWVLALLPFQALVYIGSAALRGLNKVVLGQMADLIIIPGLFAVLFLVIGYWTPVELNAASSMALRSAATFIAFAFTIIFLIIKTPSEVHSASPVYAGRVWLASALPLGLSSGLNIIRSRSNTLIMGVFVDSGQIGTFQVAVSAAALSGLVLQAANAILAPQFASLIAQDDKKSLQRLVSTSTRIVAAFNLVITIIFLLFGKFLLTTVFSSDVVDAYPSLVILLVGQLVNSFVGSVAYLLNMAGYEKDVMKIIATTTAINAIMTLVITPIWGIIGGAIATSISLIVAQFAMHRLVVKKLGIVSNAFGKTIRS